MSDPAGPGPEPLNAEEEAVLRALGRVLLVVPRVLESDLRREHGLTTSEFFVLMHLAEAPGGRLRMGDLVAATGLTPGAVTRVVKILEGAGLVERRRTETDGRGHEAELTAAGHARLEALRPAHVAIARRRVFDELGDLDLRTFAEALARISHPDPDPSDGARREHHT